MNTLLMLIGEKMMTRAEKLRRARELTHEIKDLLISEQEYLENWETLISNLYKVDCKLKDELRQVEASLLESWTREFEQNSPADGNRVHRASLEI